MSMIADKTVLFIISLFAMEKLLGGSFSVELVYILIIYSAIISRLIIDFSGQNLYEGSRDSVRIRATMVLQMIYATVPLFLHGFHVILPIGLYDMVILSNVPAMIISAVSMLLSFFTEDTPLRYSALALFISLIAILLARKEKNRIMLSGRLHALRDEDALLNLKLKKGQTELISAMDTEIVAAQLAERNRIAREIHDNVGHMLSRALLQTGAMLAVHKNEPVSEELKDLRETLDTAMNSIRESVHDLRDDSIDLDAVIDGIVEPLKTQSMTVNTELDYGELMDGKVKYAIIGIVKEAVSNIIKHSRNTCVDIRVIEHPSMYQVVVHDYTPGEHTSMTSDGKAETTDYRGMGISNMESRARSVGGTLTTSNANGFRVFARLPK